MKLWQYVVIWICGAIAVFVTVQMDLAGTGLGVAVALYLFMVLTLFALLVVDSVVESRRIRYDFAHDIDYSHVSIVSVNPDGSYNVSIGYKVERR